MKSSISTLLLSTLLSPTTFAIEHSLRQRHSNTIYNQHDNNRQLQGECEGSNPSLCGCSSVLQADYRGNINETVEGVVCQAWDSQDPHSHSRTPANYPNKGLEGEGNNYCRNPDNEPNGAWCYTTGSKRWDYCNVPTCQPSTTTTEATTTTSVLTTSSQATTTSSQATSTTSSNSSPSTCSTPELANLLELTSDLRTVYQRSNLPTIDGTSSSSSLPWEEGEETCTTLLSKKKVLLVGIDGLRADVVGMTPLPNIRRLQSMGTYSFWADVQSSASAVSGPGWASMFTGVEPSKHLVSGNGDLGDRAYPTVFKTVKDTFGLKIASSVSWHPLVNELIEQDTTLDITFKAGSDCEMAAKAVDWIRSEEYDFVFVDFDGPDSAGHSTGFDGYAETYQKRVISVDKLIGNLLDAVLDSSSSEEWLIVLTSDHGGEGTSHSAYDKYNRKIPFIVASNSPRVNVGFMPIDDPGSQMDVLPTIMHFLGGSSAVPEGLDGKVFGFKDYTRTAPPSTTDTSTCGTDSVLQADYRGTLNVTANGVACQAWDSQTPHSHSLTPCNYPDAGLESNYCRNPDGEPNGVWCYTTDPNKRWDYCNVPSC